MSFIPVFRCFSFQTPFRSTIFIGKTPQLSVTLKRIIAFDFCVYMLAFQVLGLLFRFVLSEPVRKKASSVSGVVFWGGFAWIINLLSAELIGWPAFLGWFIVVAGTSIVVQSVLTILLYSLHTP
jgi:hypothetical protein